MRNECNNTTRKLNTTELIHQIVFLIINREGYEESARIMYENNISVEKVCENTMKLTPMHIALLGDELVKL